MDIQTHELMAAALVERGIVTAEQVAADRASLERELAGDGGGFDPLAQPAAAPAQPSGVVLGSDQDDGSAIDQAAFAGPSSPTDYRFTNDPDFRPTAETMQADAEWRQALHAEAVPVSIATEVQRLLSAGLKNPPTEAQLELGRQAGEAALARVWGDSKARNLEVAKGELQRISARRPEIIPALVQSGVANSPWLAQTLYNMAKARGRA